MNDDVETPRVIPRKPMDADYVKHVQIAVDHWWGEVMADVETRAAFERQLNAHVLVAMSLGLNVTP